MSHAVSVLLDGRLVAMMAVLVVGAVVLSRPLGARLGRSRTVAFMCVITTFAVLSVTLLNRSGAFSAGLWRSITWWAHGWTRLVASSVNDPEWLLNVILFVPAGVAWSVATRRFSLVIMWASAASFAIETVQALFGLGAPEPSDWVANTIGAAVGAAAVAGVLHWRHPRAAAASIASRPSRTIGYAIAVLSAVLLIVIVVNLEASRRNNQLLADLRGVFAQTTALDLQPLVADTDGTGFEQFLSMAKVRPDSVVYLDGPRHFNVRYAFEFFGADRCVFVDFSTNRTTFRRATGRECTRFRREVATG